MLTRRPAPRSQLLLAQGYGGQYGVGQAVLAAGGIGADVANQALEGAGYAALVVQHGLVERNKGRGDAWAVLHGEHIDPRPEPFDNPRDAYAPLVWQCRYVGIEVPDALWRYQVFGASKKHSDDEAEDLVKETDGMANFDDWAQAFADFVRQKGKVPPSQYCAWGYEAPGHT